MRGFSFYGDTIDKFPFTGEEMEQYKQQVKRIRSNHRLTIVTFVLFVLAIIETMFFIAVQLTLKSSEYAGLLGVVLEILTLLVIAGAIHAYRKMSVDLRAIDLCVMIIAELLFGFSEYMVYLYKQPFYLYVIAGINFVMILYILLFIKADIKQRATLSVIPIVLFLAAGFLSINASIFTVRYVYISTSGYYNDVSNNDITHYYYTNPVNSKGLSTEITIYVKNYSSGIYSMDELNSFCKSYSGSLNMSEIINFSRTYNDNFFNSNCLYIAPVKLESPSDRINFNGLSYALSSQKPCVQYLKDKNANQSDSVCIMLIEVPLKDDAKINSVVKVKTDDIIIAK